LDSKNALRRAALAAVRGKAFTWLVAALEHVGRPRPGVLPVLTYHRVDVLGGSPLLYPGLISAEPAAFEEQMRFLATHRRPLSLAELLAVRRGEADLPLRSVMVTFDDAYRDFASVAWPILKRHGIPVTLFVPTAYPGDRDLMFWWDRLYAALATTSRRAPLASPAGSMALATEADRLRTFRRLRSNMKSLAHEQAMKTVDELCEELGAPPPVSAVLSWPELRRLHSEGVALAPHSRTHPLLNRLPAEALRNEIVGSLEDLDREMGEAPRVFAFPGGGVNDEVAQMILEARFELAFLAERGTNDLRRPDWLRLRRINVGRASGLPLVRAQLLPWWTRGPTANEGGSQFLQRV
jgi:peptidoglycan/xylan/chitin deacetylase (PgdA/CDA1 family)